MKKEESTNIYRLLRLSRNLSAAELASRLNVNKSYIHAIEAGRTPSDELKKLYAEVIGVDVALIDEYAPGKKQTTFERIMLCIFQNIVDKNPAL